MELNTSAVVAVLYKFIEFVHSKDNGQKLSFVDQNTFLGRSENYKSEIAKRAQNELKYESWQESLIGTGKIIALCQRVMACADNLVNIYQQYSFNNITSRNHKDYNPEAERVLYDIYRGVDEQAAFEHAVKIFGKRYDMIAYLFFTKDSSRFLPISPGNFEKGLASIGISYPLAHNCSWENYIGFINIVREIQRLMQDVMPYVYVRLIDAHSFLWIINWNTFRNWMPNAETSCKIESATEQYLDDAQRKSRLTSYFVRSGDVVRATRARANGKCQLCGQDAPFRDKDGLPYLEVHHIVWLSRGGADNINNTAALCPNCHARMHIVDSKDDIDELFRRINAS